MKRFMDRKETSGFKNLWISILIFIIIILLFYYSVSSLSNSTTLEQKANLERVLQESIIQCYSVEGFYPESLAYLQENYGISYNKSLFLVDYQALGSNIMPDITVISKATKK